VNVRRQVAEVVPPGVRAALLGAGLDPGAPREITEYGRAPGGGRLYEQEWRFVPRPDATEHREPEPLAAGARAWGPMESEREWWLSVWLGPVPWVLDGPEPP
jgi:hypothetical protein